MNNKDRYITVCVISKERNERGRPRNEAKEDNNYRLRKGEVA